MTGKLIVQMQIRCPECNDKLLKVGKENPISTDPTSLYYYRSCHCNNMNKRVVCIPNIPIQYQIVEIEQVV